MHTIFGWLGGFGASIVEIAIALGMFAGATAAGFYAAKRTNNNWIGWAVGIAAYVVLTLIFGPTYEAAKQIDCRHSDDYQSCMENDTTD
jgi:hypothetical protein